MWGLAGSDLEQDERLGVVNGPVPLVLDIARGDGVRTEQPEDERSLTEAHVDLIRPVGSRRNVIAVHPGLDLVRQEARSHLLGGALVGPIVGDKDVWLGHSRSVQTRAGPRAASVRHGAGRGNGIALPRSWDRFKRDLTDKRRGRAISFA